ncbi:uncharacterized protein LOC135466342 [Liolophura sinensis]|uniref:uncharacterized protein LOC135466342 n=1 Tax=Liolophura sinensis TaxID=3198878 RepID=UPI003159085E
MGKGTVPASVPPPQQNCPSENFQMNSAAGNRTCARELMFGRAPLSVSSKVHDTAKSFEVRQKRGAKSNDECNLKRKNSEIEDVDVLNGLPDRPSKVMKIVANAVQIGDSCASNKASNRQSCDKSGKLVFLNSVQAAKYCNVTNGSQEKNSEDSSGVVNFHNNTCLQADWSLPCFKTVENHVLENTIIVDKEPNRIEENDRCCKSRNSSNGESEQTNLRLNGCESVTSPTLENPVVSGWKIQSSDVKERIQNSSPTVVSSAQQQLNILQSLQLQSSGEIMVMQPNETSTQLVLVPQPYFQSQMRIGLQTSPVNVTNNGKPVGVSSHCGLNHGIVLNSLQRQSDNSGIQLNSSGEEVEQSSDARDSVSPHRAPYPSLLQEQVERAKQSLEITSPYYSRQDDSDPSRQQHNHKERIRRARIRDACHLMRQLVPGMSDKTDKATVFEFAARYVHFLRTFVGDQYDKDFLIKYSPY